MHAPATASPRVTVWALALAGLLVVAPFAFRGTACGHDLTFHMHSWMEVSQQWREGVLFPRWAAQANYGSGEPRFIFYPPLSALVGAALGSILQFVHVPAAWMYAPAVFIYCAVLLSGLSMHALAREWIDEPAATLAALAYALNPYGLLTIYVRSAYAELLAACFLPLIFLWITRNRPPQTMLVPLALTMAGVWLTNVPTAIIASYTAALLLVLVAVLRRDRRIALWGFAGILAGLALAAFYIVPVLYEERWIQVANALSPGVRPFENFLFTRTGEPEHDQFIRVLSWVALAETLATLLAMWGARRWRKSQPQIWWALAATSGAALLLMLPIANFGYRLLPALRFLQFPWRWMMVIGVAYAISIGALRTSGAKLWLYGAALAALVIGANYVLQPPCDLEDTPFMISEVYQTGYGYMGNDEYVPPGGDNYEIKPDFPEYVLHNRSDNAPAAGAHVSHLHWNTYRKQLTLDSPQPVNLVLRVMNYPAWQVTVNGSRVVPDSEDPTGRMLIALRAGHSEIDVRFARTRDRWLGDGISLVALIFLSGFWYVEKKGNA